MKHIVKLQLFKYLTNKLSKEMLYKWALDLLHKMLRDNVFKINYLEIWRIITGLVETNDMDDFYCDEMIHHYYKILSGEESTIFTFAMKIPPKLVVSNLFNLKEILKKYSAGEHLTLNEFNSLRLAIHEKFTPITTLNDILENQIIDILKCGYQLGDNGNSIDFIAKSTVFISEDEEVFLEKKLLSTVIALLECYEGSKYFFVHVNFNNGESNISVSV